MNFSLATIKRSRAFWATVAFFVVASIASGLLGSSFGFPFPVVAATPSGSTFYLLGLLLDLAVAWTAAITGVWIIRSLRNDEPDSSRSLRDRPDDGGSGIETGESAE